jgi:UDP-N-acetylglucosamine transferase subunit ALG13
VIPLSQRVFRKGGTLLVASTGGHLEELHRLAPRLDLSSEAVEWVTFDEPQSRSLLAGSVVHHVPYVKPRGYRAAARNVSAAFEILERRRFDRVVSTGSGVAIPFVLAARTRGVPCHYIESAARSQGPSLTGRVVSRIPGTRLYTQHPSWSSPKWAYRGSLFDAYSAHPVRREASSVSSVVVTLGTMRTYGFRRALDAVCQALREVLQPDAQVLWQVGATDVSDLPIQAKSALPASELRSAIRDADLVIAHAGIGSSLTALEAGHCPVLLPRRKVHAEHVDDHQGFIARDLARRELAVSCDPSALRPEHLLEAMSRTVLSRSPHPMLLNA